MSFLVDYEGILFLFLGFSTYSCIFLHSLVFMLERCRCAENNKAYKGNIEFGVFIGPSCVRQKESNSIG